MARERLTRDLIDDMVRVLQGDPDTHIVLSASLLPADGGWPRVHVDGRTIYLHRYLWMRIAGEEPPSAMRGRCHLYGCANPFHWRTRKPRGNTRAAVGKQVRLHSHCRQGHRLTADNRYWWTDHLGRQRSRCRRCQIDRQHAYRNRQKENR